MLNPSVPSSTTDFQGTKASDCQLPVSMNASVQGAKFQDVHSVTHLATLCNVTGRVPAPMQGQVQTVCSLLYCFVTVMGVDAFLLRVHDSLRIAAISRDQAA